MLNLSRLEQLMAEVIAALEAVPDKELRASMPPELRALDGALRLMRVDLVARVRTTTTDSLRRLADRAAREPDQADRLLGRAVWVLAWLDDQTDETPLTPGWSQSLRAPASSSSADVEPARQPPSAN